MVSIITAIGLPKEDVKEIITNEIGMKPFHFALFLRALEKIQRRKGLILATEAESGRDVGYLDDLRTTAKDQRLAWLASSKIAKGCAWLVLQDGARKRREPSQTPGAWAGATVSTDGNRTYRSVTQERWEKTQAKIRWLGAQVGEFDETSFSMLDMDKVEEERRETPSGKLNFKTAESY